MNKAYLLTGGNMGDRAANIRQAEYLIAEHCGPVLQRSSIYQTKAWGKEDQPDFLNQVLLIETSLSPLELLRTTLNIEATMGRVRHLKNDPRTIDIDMLFYGDRVMNDAMLQLPHPRLHLRRFVLVPLHEIAPQLSHPLLHKTIDELLLSCPDQLDVKKFSAK